MLVTYIHTRERARAKERARAREREPERASERASEREREAAAAAAVMTDADACIDRCRSLHLPSIVAGRTPKTATPLLVSQAGRACTPTVPASSHSARGPTPPSSLLLQDVEYVFEAREREDVSCMTGGWMWSKIPPVMPPLYYRSVQPAFAITAEPIPWRGRFIDGGVTGFTVSVGVPQIQLPKHPHLPLPHAPTSARVFPSAIRPCQSDLRFPCPGCRPGLLSVFPPASPFSSLNCCGRGAGFRIDVQ